MPDSLLSTGKEKFFHTLIEHHQGIIALLDENLRIVFRSRFSEKCTGWSNEEMSFVPNPYTDPEIADQVKAVYQEAVANPDKTIPITTRMKHKNGQYIWLEGTVTNRLNDPDIRGIVLSMQDVTSQRTAEEKLRQLNRLYLFMSQMNQAIVKAADATTLFREACRIAVEVGQFRMAWVGLLDAATKKVVAVTHAGEEAGYLSRFVPISLDRPIENMGPGARALKAGRLMICNDIGSAPEMAPWRESALDRGYLSSIGLPLKQSGKVVGLFSLYSNKKNFFDAEETALLDDLANDISLALELFEQETLRKKAEQELLLSKLSYQTLTESSPVGIFHTNADGLTTYVNPRWCQISGMPADEALGNGWLEAVHPDDGKALAKEWGQAAGEQRPSTYSYRFVRPNGSITWVLGQAVPEKGIDDQILGYVGTITDITDLKLAQEESDKAKQEVTNQERRFRALIENSSDGLTILNEDGTVREISPTGEKIMGYPRETLLGQKRGDMVYPEDRALLASIFRKVLAEPRQAVNVEYRIVLPDGTCRWLACTFKNLLHEPYLQGIVVNYRDITDKKNNEIRLQKSEELYRRAEAMGRIGHWEWDRHEDFLSLSDELYRILEIDKANFGNRCHEFHAMLHPADKADYLIAQEAAVTKREKLDTTPRIITPGGNTKYVHILAELVPDEAGAPRYLSGTLQDITAPVIAQNQIINERNLSDSIINSLPGVFYLFNSEGRHLRWNKNFEEVTQYTAEEIPLIRSSDLVDDDEKELLAEKIANVFRTGEDSVLAHFLRKDRVKIPYYFTGRSILYEGQPCVLGVGLDFSDRLAAQEKVKKATQQLRELAAHLQNIREEERIEIARDIHDDLGQQLTAVQIALFRLAKQWKHEVELEKQLQGITDMTAQVIKSIRRISTQLRPAVLDDIGLVEAMKWQSEEFERRFSIPVTAFFSDIPDNLQQDIAVALFRIYQETLTNIARHAEASHVQVRLTSELRQISLEVQDDGKGFDEEIISSKRTLGLLGMQERALMIGGEFIFSSTPGKGTTIKILIPLEKN
ncbi:MAG TPA: PAS domain S-box protein [Puia sp.]|nr:PAS domain S-box protein [Puia sp.]